MWRLTVTIVAIGIGTAGYDAVSEGKNKPVATLTSELYEDKA